MLPGLAGDVDAARRQALGDALNVGHDALVMARRFGDQRECGGVLLKRQEMGWGFPDSLATSLQPDGQTLCDALNVGHTAFVNARLLEIGRAHV